MAKKIKTQVKLLIKAGKASPTPPIGPALGQHGVNIMEFCTQFNAKTKDNGETSFPTVITIYEDRSFDFIIKTPPASILIKKALNIEKGSGSQLKEKVGKLSKEQLEEIATVKLPDLNTKDIIQAQKIIAGTAKNMGVEVEE
jgi:large subunit ribosomal protein L11